MSCGGSLHGMQRSYRRIGPHGKTQSRGNRRFTPLHSPFGRLFISEGRRMGTLIYSDIPGLVCRRGKVRDIYDLGDRLVLIATDRISAFDWVLPTPIPDKGRILTALTLFWLDFLRVPHHLLSTDLEEMGPAFAERAEQLQGRTCLVKKTTVFPV